jgi:hypothetical protein
MHHSYLDDLIREAAKGNYALRDILLQDSTKNKITQAVEEFKDNAILRSICDEVIGKIKGVENENRG